MYVLIAALLLFIPGLYLYTREGAGKVSKIIGVIIMVLVVLSALSALVPSDI